MNSNNLRKRARTFESGLDGAADDESEVKGGHSLRKRARVDYAQIGDEEETTPDNSGILAKADAKPSAAPSSRGRKRRANEVDYDTDDLPPSTVTKKRGRYEKQRTESPASSRRKQPQRKTSTQSKTYVAEQQPSDTELKDTIEVGVQYSEFDSSDEQSSFKQSDTASIASERSTEEKVAEVVAMTNLEVSESNNIVTPTTHSEPHVLTSSDDKPVKTEDFLTEQPQDLSNNVNSTVIEVNNIIPASPQQPPTDPNLVVNGPADEQQSTNTISVSKPDDETENRVSDTTKEVSTTSEELKVIAEPDVAQAPEETTTKSVATQPGKPTVTLDKASP